MTTLPSRKSNRLSHYSYSSTGCYFLTLCAVEKRCLFCRIHNCDPSKAPTVQLSNYGILIEKQIQAIQQIYSDLHIDHYVVMPNHVHLLVSILSDTKEEVAPANAKIPFLVSTLKRMTNKSAGCNLWHRSYHDHVIRDEADYLRRWKYIDDNPMKWTSDRFYISET